MFLAPRHGLSGFHLPASQATGAGKHRPRCPAEISAETLEAKDKLT